MDSLSPPQLESMGAVATQKKSISFFLLLPTTATLLLVYAIFDMFWNDGSSMNVRPRAPAFSSMVWSFVADSFAAANFSLCFTTSAILSGSHSMRSGQTLSTTFGTSKILTREIKKKQQLFFFYSIFLAYLWTVHLLGMDPKGFFRSSLLPKE